MALVGTLLYLELAANDEPASFAVEADVGAAREREGRFYLPVTVTNTGGRAARAIVVAVEQRVGERDVGTEVVVELLAPGEDAEIVAVLADDPRRAPPRVGVRSYLRP